MSVDEIKKKKAFIKNTVTKLQEKQAGAAEEEQEVPAEPAAAAEGAEPAGEEQPEQTAAEEVQPMETEGQYWTSWAHRCLWYENVTLNLLCLQRPSQKNWLLSPRARSR